MFDNRLKVLRKLTKTTFMLVEVPIEFEDIPVEFDCVTASTPRSSVTHGSKFIAKSRAIKLLSRCFFLRNTITSKCMAVELIGSFYSPPTLINFY